MSHSIMGRVCKRGPDIITLLTVYVLTQNHISSVSANHSIMPNEACSLGGYSLLIIRIVHNVVSMISARPYCWTTLILCKYRKIKPAEIISVLCDERKAWPFAMTLLLHRVISTTLGTVIEILFICVEQWKSTIFKSATRWQWPEMDRKIHKLSSFF